MAKIDILSNEIKKYTKGYSDILVGMHNDMTKYKNEVKSQEVKTDYALQLINEDITQVKQLRIESEDKYQKTKEYYLYISEAEKNIQNAIAEFKTEKQAMYNSISSIKDELSKKMDAKDEKLQKQIACLAENLSLTKEELSKLIYDNNIKLNNELNFVKKGFQNKQNIIICFMVLLSAAIGYLYYKML